MNIFTPDRINKIKKYSKPHLKIKNYSHINNVIDLNDEIIHEGEIFFKCNKCTNIWFMSAQEHLDGQGCPLCEK